MKRVTIAFCEAGVSAIEFALTLPVFLIVLVVVIEGGLLMWTQLGLQNGVEKAARCASIQKSTCGSSSAIQQYAAQNSYGLHPPASAFTVSSPACGNQVSATFVYNPVSKFFFSHAFHVTSITLTATSCFPS